MMCVIIFCCHQYCSSNVRVFVLRPSGFPTLLKSWIYDDGFLFRAILKHTGKGLVRNTRARESVRLACCVTHTALCNGHIAVEPVGE